jgi:transposase
MVHCFPRHGGRRYGINQKTVAKWRKRSSVADLPTEATMPAISVTCSQNAASRPSFRQPARGGDPSPRHQGHRDRNLGERMWCRLKDWRRVATRYDTLAQNYLAGALVAATVTYWPN